MTEPIEWVVAASYDAIYKAEMAVAQLEGADISARLDRKGGVGLFGLGFGGTTVRGVDVLVTRECLDAAREVLGLEE